MLYEGDYFPILIGLAQHSTVYWLDLIFAAKCRHNNLYIGSDLSTKSNRLLVDLEVRCDAKRVDFPSLRLLERYGQKYKQEIAKEK